MQSAYCVIGKNAAIIWQEVLNL